MAREIEWQEPVATTVTRAKVHRSATKFGTYSLSSTVNTTSDGSNKSSSNTWVTTYLDASGEDTHWYKLQFYDSSNALWSDYSDAITGVQEVKLCTVDEVKDVLETAGRWTDSEIFTAICCVEEDIYDEMGTPIKESYSVVGSRDSVNQDIYYVGEENLTRVDRVFYGTTTKSEIFLDDGYKTNLKFGMIRILPVASGGPALDTDCTVVVRFVPKLYNRLAIYQTAKFLLEKLDTVDRGTVSNEMDVINHKLGILETRCSQRVGIRLSSDFANYDNVYGVNRKLLVQDHDKNKYLVEGSQWD